MHNISNLFDGDGRMRWRDRPKHVECCSKIKQI